MRIPLLLIISAAVMAGSIAPDLQSEITLSGSSDLIPVFILAHGELDASWVQNSTAGMDRFDRPSSWSMRSWIWLTLPRPVSWRTS